MITFVGVVGSARGVGPTTLFTEQQGTTEQSGEWTSAYPLWVSGASSGGWRRQAAAPGVLVDVFGFNPASCDQVGAAAREFARSGDLMVLDSIATGSGVLIARERRRVTVLTDLAGVWPVFYATVGDSVVYSVQRLGGGQVRG